MGGSVLSQVLVGVLALVSACGAPERDDTTLELPRRWSEASQVGPRGQFSFRLALDPEAPALHEFFTVTTRLSDARSGEPVEGALVEADARMPEHGHGMATRPEHRELGGGRYQSRGMKLHMPGLWVFSACARRGAREDCIEVPYREEVR